MKKSVAVSMSALLVGAGFMGGMIATVNLYGPARTRDLIEEEAERRTFNCLQGVVKASKVHGTENSARRAPDALVDLTAVKEEVCIEEAKKIAVSYITNMHQMIGHVGLNVKRVVVDKSDWMVVLQHIGENRHYYRIAHKNGSGTTIQDLGTTWDMSWVGREIDRGDTTEEHAGEISVLQGGLRGDGEFLFHNQEEHLAKIDRLTENMRLDTAAKLRADADKNRG